MARFTDSSIDSIQRFIDRSSGDAISSRFRWCLDGAWMVLGWYLDGAWMVLGIIQCHPMPSYAILCHPMPLYATICYHHCFLLETRICQSLVGVDWCCLTLLEDSLGRFNSFKY